MRLSNKPNIVTGSILLLGAAFFSIALALLPMDFGSYGPGSSSALYTAAYSLGNVLFSVYGFSSILIPVFLFIAGISCFASRWTARKSMRLLTAIVPFFTSVIIEKICRAMLEYPDEFTGIKIILTVAIGGFLVAIEILAAGILADRVNDKLFHSDKSADHSDFENEEYDQDELVAAKDFKPATTLHHEISEDSKNKKEVPADVSSNDNMEGADNNENTEAANNGTETTVMAENAGETAAAVTAESTSVKPDPFEHVFDEPATTKKNNYANSETAETPQEPLLSKEEYDALNKLNEELIEGNSNESENKDTSLDLPEEEQLEWPSTDEIISQAGITKSEEESLLGEEASEENEISDSEQDEQSEAVSEEKAEAADNSENSEIDSYDFIEINDSNNTEEPNSADFTELNTENTDTEENQPDIYDAPVIPETREAKTSDNPYSEFGFDETVSESSTKESYDSDGYFDNSENPYSDSEYIDTKTQKKTENSLAPDFFDIDMNEEEPSAGSEETDDDQDIDFEKDEDSDFAPKDEEERLKNDEILKMQALEDDLLANTVNADSSIEQKRSFLDDMVDAQEDDDDFDGHFAESYDSEETPEQSEKSEFSDSDEDDFGRTNSTFNIASDIFADMEEDAREQIESGKKPSRFAQPEYDAAMNSSTPESADSDNGVQADSENDGTMSGIETAEPPARTTIATEPKPLGNRAKPKKPYIVPTDLLEQYEDDQYWIIDDQTKNDAVKLKDTLNQFGIEAEVIGIKKGPVVTMFELAPAPGVKLSKIVSLQDNIALSLAASSVRIVAPIPGKAAVGIEIPNKKRSIVSFREMIEQDLPEFKKMAVPVILGKDILGKSQIIDIAKTPHLLIAGATGAGKSVCVNSLILSILYKRSPREVKMILVDPKVVELKLYNDIPHLLTPVITEPKKALQALQYCLCEMERRYALLDGMGVRDISNYNKRIEERHVATEKLPYIVVIIDEFADLMATSGRDLESIVARLTAMSRAVGIHLVLATQRPSVNVITGLIKANIPSRIAFMVSSRTDSNIIIDSVGAEKLLGKGDMLYASAVDPYPVRIQGTFESDNDVENVVNYVKTLGEPEYIDDEIFIEDEEDEEASPNLFSDGDDPLYEQALDIVIQAGKASASYIQRRLKIGYNRAARLVEEMEARGIVGPANGSKPREVIHVPS